MEYKQLGENLKFLIRELGISRKYLAEKIEVSSNSISNWTNGVFKPQSQHLDNLCAFFNQRIPGLNLTPDRLINEDLSKKEVVAKKQIREGLVATSMGILKETIEEMDLGEEGKFNLRCYESPEELEQLPSALAEILQDEAIRSLLKLTPEEINVLKSFRFMPSFKPSKEFYFRALFDYRKEKKRGRS